TAQEPPNPSRIPKERVLPAPAPRWRSSPSADTRQYQGFLDHRLFEFYILNFLFALDFSRLDHARVPMRTGFGRALLRVIVHMDQPEALVVAGGPLEIVHDRPCHVPRDGDAFAHGAMQPAQVFLVIQNA